MDLQAVVSAIGQGDDETKVPNNHWSFDMSISEREFFLSSFL